MHACGADRFERFFGEKGLVGRDEDVGKGRQPCQQVVSHDVERMILEKDSGFLFVYIQCEAADFTTLESSERSFGVNECSATGVHDNHALTHFFETLAVNDVVRLWRQRAVKTNDIGLFKKCFERHERDTECFQITIGIEVVGQYLRAKTRENACRDASDFSRSHDAYGALANIESEQAVDRVVAFLDPGVGPMDAAV